MKEGVDSAAAKNQVSVAEQACIDIFNDFDESEIDGFALSIVNAWKAGRDLS